MKTLKKAHGNKGKKRRKETATERLHRVFLESKGYRSEIQRHRRISLGPLNSIDVAGRRGYDEARFGISAFVMPDELHDALIGGGDTYRFIEELVTAAGGRLDYEVREVWSGNKIPQQRYVEFWGFVKNPASLDLELIRAHYRHFRKKLGLDKKDLKR